MLDAQLCFLLTMLFKENLMENVETVQYGEVLRLWRVLVTDFQPPYASRKMLLQECIVNFSFGASEDPRKAIVWETQIRQGQSTTKKKIDDCTRTGVLLKALANGSELHVNWAINLVLNAYRVESCSEMQRELQDDLGMKQWPTGGGAEAMAVGGGQGKQS